MKRPRTTQVLCALLVLWSIAIYSLICAGVIAFGWIATKRTPWDMSKEETRASGERVVAALEEYKATHGHYPQTLAEVGIDTSGFNSYCHYIPQLQSNTFTLIVSSGPDQWWYRSGSQEWEWELNAGSGG